MTTLATLSKSICIGGVTVRLHTTDPAYLDILEQRYFGFPAAIDQPADYDFDVDLISSADESGIDPDEDVAVVRDGRLWRLSRGDFRAEWDPISRQGHIRQALSPYAIDSLLRIVHTIVLAEQGGVLLHAASAVRHGKAFVFTGVSGAGKTTISRLAPKDATLLTDEVSYLRFEQDGCVAYGTPFAGELATPGENVRAPLEVIYLLTQGPENRIDPVSNAEATRALLGNILFFAKDPALVQAVFATACRLAEQVPVKRLTFLPDQRVWELIQ